jgi:hypothetical protein
MEFLRRFREVKGMCFSLNMPDDQLADMAVAGMLPAIREKLFGMEFDNLGQLSQRLSLMRLSPGLPSTMIYLISIINSSKERIKGRNLMMRRR